MSFDWSEYLVRLAQGAGPAAEGINWAVAIPATVDYAEQRCYRELDLLSTVVRDGSANCTPNSRNLTLPIPVVGRFVIVQGINIVTPIGTEVVDGTLNPLVPASVEQIMYSWPSNTAASITTIPENFAMVTEQDVIFGPPPGDAFSIEVYGHVRPNPFSATNPQTGLSLYFPDLFFAASMIQLSTYGPQGAANPAIAVWEQAYQTSKGSATLEEGRKRFAGASWTSHAVQPAAQPQRG